MWSFICENPPLSWSSYCKNNTTTTLSMVVKYALGGVCRLNRLTHVKHWARPLLHCVVTFCLTPKGWHQVDIFP